MGNLVFNQGLGQVVANYRRVDENTPGTATWVVALLATTGLETDAVLRDKTTFADVVSGATNEATNGGYARKVLTDADLAAFTPDLVNDRADLTIPPQTWVSVLLDGTGAISKLVTCYDETSLGVTPSAMIPQTLHDFVVTPDKLTVPLAA